MPIHPKVRKLYEKYYSKVTNKDVINHTISENFLAGNQLDKRFLEEVSEIIYSLELVVQRYIDGNH